MCVSECVSVSVSACLCMNEAEKEEERGMCCVCRQRVKLLKNDPLELHIQQTYL